MLLESTFVLYSKFSNVFLIDSINLIVLIELAEFAISLLCVYFNLTFY